LTSGELNDTSSSSSSSSGSHEGGRFGGNSSSSGSHEGGKSGGWSRGKSGSHSGGRSGGVSGEKDDKCRKTPEQHKCIKDEMEKLAKDSAFVDVMNTLYRQKKKCKQIVTWSCTAKCPKKQKCIFKATKPCRQAFMQRMGTCLQEKGFTLPPFMKHGDMTSAFTTPLPIPE